MHTRANTFLFLPGVDAGETDESGGGEKYRGGAKLLT